MINKKIIILLGTMILFSAGMLFGWRSSPLAANAETILKNDRERLERNLNPESLRHKSWANVNDYSISAKKLVDVANAKDLFRLTNGNLDNLASCLKKDFCGMQRRNDRDAYFDESKTPGHILLERNLSIMIEALRIKPVLKINIDWDLIHELTENSNENIQVLAIKLIKDFEAKDWDTYDMFKIVDNYKGNAKAEALAELSISDWPNDHELLINSVEKSFALDDPNTVISVVEKLIKMNFSTDEILNASKHLCHYKENGADNPNWKMIKYDMSKVNVDLGNICTN